MRIPLTSLFLIMVVACSDSKTQGVRQDLQFVVGDTAWTDRQASEEATVEAIEDICLPDESFEEFLDVIQDHFEDTTDDEISSFDVFEINETMQDLSCATSGCSSGYVCINDNCEPCIFNFACGLTCEDCSKTLKPLCLEGVCVECRVQSDCHGKGWCKDNECVPCTDDDPDHCGAECARCEGKTPICVQGMCACSGSSCGNEYCLNGHCDPCDSDAACGPSCLPCGGETPYCVSKTCVECITDLDCGQGKWCNSNTCVLCGDDPLHCGPACVGCPKNAPQCVDGACRCTPTSCGQGSQCINGTCVGCTTPAACGPSCVPCSPPTPYCFMGDHCVECQPETASTDCPPNWWCDANGICTDPCAGTSGCITDTISSNGTKCATAWVLGRKDLAKGLTISGNTSGRKNDDDLPSKTIFTPNNPDCWDANEDDAYKVWMFAQDVLSVTAKPLSPTFDLSLKLYKGTSCAPTWQTDLITCQWHADDGQSESYTYVASNDGWVSIVVDGASAFTDEGDFGPYSLTAKLVCSGLKCCCQ